MSSKDLYWLENQQSIESENETSKWIFTFSIDLARRQLMSPVNSNLPEILVSKQRTQG